MCVCVGLWVCRRESERARARETEAEAETGTETGTESACIFERERGREGGRERE